ncbi:MAG TPA: hypothetical protein PJ986_09730 [Gammaproteobacteria bacterium]|nr:hypothetical protein [Gammaproteobacteria bacterium]
MKEDAKDLPQLIETTMQVIVALRWAAQGGATLPDSLDTASQEVLEKLYAWQRRRGETHAADESACGRGHEAPGGASSPGAMCLARAGRALA